MSITLERLEAEVTVNTSRARAELARTRREFDNTAEAAENAGDKAEKAGKKAEKGGKGFNAAGALIKTMAASTAAALAGKVITAASDLNEELSKAGVVFGPQAKRVTRAADQMARQFGVNKTEFLQAAGGLGLIAKASGESRREAAKMSIQMGRLAADAASFYNVPMADALADIKSGLVGEAEPMRKYGVLLNETAVGNEAIRLGLTKNAKALTEGMKVQARASLITRGMKDANGDLARTQNSVANQTRKLKGQVMNMAADLGTKALPKVAEFLQLLNDKGPAAAKEFGKVWGTYIQPPLEDVLHVTESLTKVIDGLPGPVKNNALAIGLLAAALYKASGPGMAFTGRLDTMARGLGTAEGRMTALKNSSRALGSGLATVAGAAGMMAVAKSTQQADKGVQTFMATVGGAATGLAVGGPIGAAIGGVGGLLFGLMKKTKGANDEFGNTKPPADYASSLDKVSGAATKATREVIRLALSQDKDLTASMGRVGVSMRDAIDAQMGDVGAKKRIIATLKNVTGETVRWTDAWGVQHTALTGNQVDIERVRAGLAAQGQEMDKQARKTRDNARATESLAKVYRGIPKDVRTTIRSMGTDLTMGEIVRLRAHYKWLDRRQIATILKANNYPVTKAQIDAVIKAAKDYGKQHPTATLNANTKPAKDAIAGVTTYLNSIIRTPWNIPVTVTRKGGGPKAPHKAMGGTVAGARRPYGDKVLTWLAPGEEVISNARGQADRNRSLLKAINANRYAGGGTVTKGKPKGHPGVPGSSDALLAALTGTIAKATATVKALVKATQKGTAARRIAQREGKRLTATMARRDAIAGRLASATARRDDLIQQRASFRDSVRTGISAQANVLNSGNSAAQIATNLATQVGKVKEFASALQKMRKMGYSNAVVQQVAAAGIEGGLEVAKALTAASAAEVKSISSSFGYINAAADQQAALLGSQMYDSGIQAANGLVKGLTQQQKAVERTLEQIAKGMVKALRKALGIRSPSRVFRGEMNHVGKGIILGARDQEKAVMRSTASLAQAAINGFSGQPLGMPAAAARLGQGAGGAVHLEFKTYNPVAEPQSRTTNKALNRVAALGLV